jgi:hypothetical protein
MAGDEEASPPASRAGARRRALLAVFRYGAASVGAVSVAAGAFSLLVPGPIADPYPAIGAISGGAIALVVSVLGRRGAAPSAARPARIRIASLSRGSDPAGDFPRTNGLLVRSRLPGLGRAQGARLPPRPIGTSFGVEELRLARPEAPPVFPPDVPVGRSTQRLLLDAGGHAERRPGPFSDEELDRLFPPDADPPSWSGPTGPGTALPFESSVPTALGLRGWTSSEWARAAGPDGGPSAAGSTDLLWEAANPVPPHLRGFPRPTVHPGAALRRTPRHHPPWFCADCCEPVSDLRTWAPCPECRRPMCRGCIGRSLATGIGGRCEACGPRDRGVRSAVDEVQGPGEVRAR